jgi:CheY-like chemotaxis protein
MTVFTQTYEDEGQVTIFLRSGRPLAHNVMRSMAGSDTITVLLVEDNRGDVEMARLILQESGLAYNFTCVKNGEEAMKYLAREFPYESAKTPDLVLIDLNLPRLSGYAVLEEIKDLRTRGQHVTAVAIWSRASDENSKRAAEILGADAFFVKPYHGTHAYREIVTGISELWRRMTKNSSEWL